MHTYPETIKLPDEFSLGIGRVVVAYANLEAMLRSIVYECAGIGPKEGRVLQISRRSGGYLELVKELLKAKGKDIDLGKQPGETYSLQQVLKVAEDERNRLAHGLWVVVPDVDKPVLQVVEGTWTLPDGSVALRKIKPQGWLLGDEYLSAVVEHMEACSVMVGRFRNRVRSILAA